MKIISSAGYGFCGTTAITDLISEYESVHSCEVTGYELKFFYDTQGIFHLRNHLVQERLPSAMNTAINEFYTNCQKWAVSGNKMNYEKFFDGHFMEYTNDYIEKLGGTDYIVQLDYSGLTARQWLIYRIINKVNSTVRSIGQKKQYAESHIKSIPVFAKEMKYRLYDLDAEEFDEITREYFRKLFSCYSDKAFMNIHELVPIQMLDACTRYFDDIYIISIDRDPRDVFLTARHKYIMNSHPSQDVSFYCKHYRWIRELKREIRTSNVLDLRFEDLVLHYDATVKKIEEYLGLDSADHKDYKARFIPENAMKNCNLKNQYPEEKDNIAIIERELKEYLYDF